MSNKALIVGALVLGYMYIQRNGGIPTTQKGVVVVPSSMPASSGSGWQQVKVGAVAGLLQGILGAPRNNTPTTSIPTNYDWYDRSGVVQDAVNDFPTSLDSILTGDSGTWWA